MDYKMIEGIEINTKCKNIKKILLNQNNNLYFIAKKIERIKNYENMEKYYYFTIIYGMNFDEIIKM